MTEQTFRIESASYDATENIDLSSRLRSLEEQLLDPAIRRSPAALAVYLDDDFQEFGSSGRIFSKASIISELTQESSARLTLTDFRVFPLSAEIVLVTYISARMTDAEEPHFLRSSIWVKKGGFWKIRFHQGTRRTGGGGHGEIETS